MAHVIPFNLTNYQTLTLTKWHEVIHTSFTHFLTTGMLYISYNYAIFSAVLMMVFYCSIQIFTNPEKLNGTVK